MRDPLNSRLAPFGTTIFATMSALAVETGAINLGQGFPDTDGPSEVLDTAVNAIRSVRISIRRALECQNFGMQSPNISSGSGA